MNNNTLNPSSSLVSVPNSLKDQIDRAQNLLEMSSRAEAEGDTRLAVVRAKQGLKMLRSLAQSSPELAMLGFVAAMGYTGYEFETIEHIDRYQIVDRKLLGVTIGSDVVNVPTITRRVVRARVSGSRW